MNAQNGCPGEQVSVEQHWDWPSSSLGIGILNSALKLLLGGTLENCLATEEDMLLEHLFKGIL
jgi:hypothetical protein